MIKYFFTFLFLIVSVFSHAQLLNEIGISVGGSNYSGDIGREAFIYPNKLAGGMIYRRNVNSRITLRGTFSVYQLEDNDAYSSNEVRQRRGYSFNNTLAEVAFGIELNYWDYDITRPAYAYTPYLFFELAGFNHRTITGVTDGAYDYSNEVSYAIPFGFGFKGGITRNLGYALELRARYTFLDDLDYNNQDIPSLRFGNDKTNDWYFFSGVVLTYSFGRPPCAVPRRE